MAAIKVYGAPWCPDCQRAKKFLGEQKVTYDWIDIESDEEGRRIVQEKNNGKQIIPTIFFEDGSILVEPTNAELAQKLGIQTEPTCDFYDLVVMGAGPAGLTAALYAAREGIETLVVERSSVGGQAGITEQLDNFPGFPDGISGAEFADRLHRQVLRFGGEVLAAQNISRLIVDGDYRGVQTESGTEVRAKAALLTTGSTYRRLHVPGEEDFIGAGIHFCATCDGPFYKGQEVLVIGGGNSGVQEAIFLTKYAPKVTLITNGAELTASAVLQQKASELPQIQVLTDTVVEEFTGNGRLAAVTVRSRQSNQLATLNPRGVFVFIGLQPNTELAKGVVALDERGFVTTGMGLETSVPGLFAAGDVRAGSTKQAASAVGEGASAALAIREYLKER